MSRSRTAAPSSIRIVIAHMPRRNAGRVCEKRSGVTRVAGESGIVAIVPSGSRSVSCSAVYFVTRP